MKEQTEPLSAITPLVSSSSPLVTPQSGWRRAWRAAPSLPPRSFTAWQSPLCRSMWVKSLVVFFLQTPKESTQQAWSPPTHLFGTQHRLVEGVLIHLSPPSQQVPLVVQEEQDGHHETRLQPQDFLEQPLDNSARGLDGGLRDLMAGMMGGAQEILVGGETVQQTLFMIQGVMWAKGPWGNSTTIGQFLNTLADSYICGGATNLLITMANHITFQGMVANNPSPAIMAGFCFCFFPCIARSWEGCLHVITSFNCGILAETRRSGGLALCMFLRPPSQAKLSKHSWTDPQLYDSQAGENRGVVNALEITGDGLLSASRTSPLPLHNGREGGMSASSWIDTIKQIYIPLGICLWWNRGSLT